MEKQLPRTSILSLREMALRKIAMALWNESRTLVLIRNYRCWHSITGFDKSGWCRVVESEVSGKIPELLLPKSLEKQVIRVLEPIGAQIIRWKLYHEAYLRNSDECFDVPVLQKLRWTAAGAVDYVRTAEELVRSDVLDIVKRYKLACLYCLDHYIPELWRELPSEKKMWFSDEERFDGRHLYCYWPYVLKGEEYKLNQWTQDSIPFNQYAFQVSSSQGNKAAAQYFLRKLSPEEREASLVSAANDALESTLYYFRPTAENIAAAPFPDTNFSDVVFYLLSEMTPEQQIQVFRERPVEVLGCFMNWPWQDSFPDSADAVWTWMQCGDLKSRARNYDDLLEELQRIMFDSDYPFPSLILNFFLHSPGDFKKHFVSMECEDYAFLSGLFYDQDTEAINVILNNLDEGDKVRLVSTANIVNPFIDSISDGKGHVVEKCLRETRLSKEGKKCVKEAFMKLQINLETPEWRRFFEFLDETDAKGKGKRSSDDETSTESKKKLLC